ncbi:MAG: HypC/HybG/HupF family hydrogenase formation chaperone [bacterium]|nr:HypC/HybG/HupF family hydrogenase formation chaperone [bacterium]
MCLAIPMRIKEIHDNNVGVVEADGAEARVSIALVKDPEIGDYVIIHAGYAIEKIDKEEAEKTKALFDELAELNATS